MDLVGNNGFDLLVAADVVAGALSGAVLHLFQTDFVPDRNTTLAELTAAIATYTGYASEAVTWLAPSVTDTGDIEVVGTVGEFRPTGAIIANQIFGCYLVDAEVVPNLLFCARFEDAPYPMASTLNAIIVTLRYNPRTGARAVTVS